MDSWPPNGQGASGTFTLTAEGKSFWEILTQLSDQHGLMLESYNGLRLQTSQPGYHHFFPAPSGFAIFPMSITKSTLIDPQKPEGGPAAPLEMRLRYEIGSDPRMKIVKYSQPVLEEVVDDAGNNLLAPGNTPSWTQENQQGQCMFQTEALLKVPANMGKKIAVARGSGTFWVVLAEDVVEVDPKDVMNKEIKVGEKIVTITEWNVEGNNIHFQINAAGENDAVGIGVTFVDANGKVVWAARLGGGIGGGAGGQFVEPREEVRLYRRRKR